MQTTPQLDLFAAGPEAMPVVGPAPVSEALCALADRLPGGLRLGTSSWSFPGWHGLVYDRAASKGDLARDGLSAYARHPLLGAVGLDRTWYTPLSAATLGRYAAAVPAAFRFLVKAPAACTTPIDYGTGRTNPRYLDAAWLADKALAPMLAGLGRRAAALLLQFPPLPPERAQRFAGELGAFLARLPRDAPIAVEVRNPGLASDAYFDVLARHGVSHCASVHPRSPPVTRQLERMSANGPLLIRWNLRAGLRYEAARERYAPFDRIVDPDTLTRERLADACVGAHLAGREVLVIANNKAEGSAPLTLAALASAIAERLAGTNASTSPERGAR